MSIGYCTHDLLLYPQLSDQVFAAVKSLGGDRVRVAAVWSGVETSKGVYDWSAIDTIIASAEDAGVEVLLLLNLPRAVYGGFWFWTTTGTASDFARFASIAAARYPTVKSFEICNEINTAVMWNAGGVFGSGSGVAPADYVSYLKGAYGAIKAVSPQAEVGFAGLAPVVDVPGGWFSSGPNSTRASEFVSQCLAAGAGGYFDFMSYHPYPLASDWSTFQPPTANQPMIAEIVAIGEVLRQAGISVPLDCTEWGFASADFPGAAQLTQYQQEWGVLSSDPFKSLIRHHYLYCLRDFVFPGQTWSATDREMTFGVLTQSLGDKTVAPWLRSTFGL